MIDYVEKEYAFTVEQLNTLYNLDCNSRNWWPIGNHEIVFRTPDDKINLFYAYTNGFVCNYDPRYAKVYQDRINILYTEPYYDEIIWRKEFAKRFGLMLDRCMMTKNDIYELTGISKMTLNRYGKYTMDFDMMPIARLKDVLRTPNLYNAVKLATALQIGLSNFYIPADYVIDLSRLIDCEQWNFIVDILINKHADLVRDTVSWYVTNYNEIVVTLSSGDKYAINSDDILHGSRMKSLKKILVYTPRMKVMHDKSNSWHEYEYDYKLEFMSEEDYCEEFSSKLIWLIHKNGMSQSELARKIGVTRTMINRYATGKVIPSLYTATKMVRALGCSLDEFHII